MKCKKKKPVGIGGKAEVQEWTSGMRNEVQDRSRRLQKAATSAMVTDLAFELIGIFFALTGGVVDWNSLKSGINALGILWKIKSGGLGIERFDGSAGDGAEIIGGGAEDECKMAPLWHHGEDASKMASLASAKGACKKMASLWHCNEKIDGVSLQLEEKVRKMAMLAGRNTNENAGGSLQLEEKVRTMAMLAGRDTKHVDRSPDEKVCNLAMLAGDNKKKKAESLRWAVSVSARRAESLRWAVSSIGEVKSIGDDGTHVKSIGDDGTAVSSIGERKLAVSGIREVVSDRDDNEKGERVSEKALLGREERGLHVEVSRENLKEFQQGGVLEFEIGAGNSYAEESRSSAVGRKSSDVGLEIEM